MMLCVPNLITCCSTVTLKETNSGEVRAIYDAKEVIYGLQAVKDAEVTNDIHG